MRERIRTAYFNIPDNARVLPADENPVKKVLLVITGDEGLVYLDEVGDPGNDGGGPAVRQQANEREQMLALQSQISALQRSLQDIRASQDEQRVEGRREFQMLQSNIRRIAVQPVVRRAAAVENGGAVAAVPATLSPTPRTLHLLWDEYERGIGGRKAARLFSREERGRAKHKYHRRKVVWDCVAGLVRAGFSSEVAIDRVYQVYGENTTVTRIINKMKEDRQAGIVHPSLQV
jgi:hypothetical protein